MIVKGIEHHCGKDDDLIRLAEYLGQRGIDIELGEFSVSLVFLDGARFTVGNTYEGYPTVEED